MRAELGGLNHCAVPVLSRAAANMCWYYYIPLVIVTNAQRAVVTRVVSAALIFQQYKTVCVDLRGLSEHGH